MNYSSVKPYIAVIAAFVVVLIVVINYGNRMQLFNNHEKNIVSRQLRARNCPAVSWLPPFRKRVDLGDILRELNMKTGVELGVQGGGYSADILRRWRQATDYVLVDLWAHQNNYKDIANVDDKEQLALMDGAVDLIKGLERKGFAKNVTVCRNLTTICAQRFRDKYFDFIYVDARHDYKGVLQDITDWWPKLSQGGIMAGHDYTFQSEPSGTQSGDPTMHRQDWTLNFDGTRDTTGRVVRGAVDDFFSDKTGALHGCPRQVTVSYREAGWNTWAVRK
eukprot:gene9460-19644_t